jgi:hypothetical protein
MDICKCENKHEIITGIVICVQCNKPKYEIPELMNYVKKEKSDSTDNII